MLTIKNLDHKLLNKIEYESIKHKGVTLLILSYEIS